MRIVSLLPSATEVVAALGLGENLVGRSHECDYPPAVVQDLPVLTRAKMNPQASSLQIDQDVRAIVEQGLSVYEVDAALLKSLAPDVIVTQSQCELCAVSEADVTAAVAEFSGKRPAILSLTPMTLDDIFADIARAGEVLEVAAAGEKLAATLRAGIAAIAEKTAGLEPIPVFYMEWIAPLMGAGNWMPAIWRAAGGEILLGGNGVHSPVCSWADLLQAAPEVVVVGPCGFDLNRARRELQMALADAETRAQWESLRAVARDNVYIADGNQYYNRPGPRVLESAQIAAEILHPEIVDANLHGAGWQRWSDNK